MFIPQESHSLHTANPRHNMKIMSSASFSLACLIGQPHKNSEANVGSRVNIGYVSDMILKCGKWS